MSKITSKLQVTIPKAIAEQYGLRPGDEVDWQPFGDAIRLAPHKPKPELSVEERLRLFHETDAWIKSRRRKPIPESVDRGWKREDLYTRGRRS